MLSYKERKDFLVPRGFGNILHHCFRCGYDWSSYLERPSVCSRCCSNHWDTPLGTRFVQVFPCLCLKCGHQWDARTLHPAKCPKCTHFLWYEPRNARAKDVFANLASLETDECIVWPLSVIHDGYGRLRVGKKTKQVHILAYEKRIGEVPEGMKVCHHCDNPPCLNYRHLFLGTVQDNNEDKRLKKRHCFGETSGMAKLTEEQVREIRAKYVYDIKNRAQRQLRLGEEYGVGQTVISAIVRRKTWKHI
jgi:predicted Zn-ribbon and HTH transcriptional regulator